MLNENNAMMVPDQYGQIVYNRSVFSAIARNVVEETEKLKLQKQANCSLLPISPALKMENFISLFQSALLIMQMSAMSALGCSREFSKRSPT